MTILFILFFSFGAKTQAIHDVAGKCLAASDKGAVCCEMVQAAKSTNQTPLGIDD